MSRQVIRFAKIPLSFNLPLIQEEIRALPAHWKSHQNISHYEGGWTVLSLRAPGGNPEHIAADLMGKDAYANTPLLGEAPTLRALLDVLPCPVQSARLLRLAPGSLIKEHRDAELSFEQGEARLHFPIFTHPLVDFTIDGERVYMQEGECWYINANLPHRVSNPGPTERIHLVIDCTVSTGLQDLFEQSERRYSTTDIHQGAQAQIIQALRLMKTDTASRLADEMEQQLNAQNNVRPDLL
jgi:quercetin dioxygenase-like cupin family protein